jgi:hypothetical protein
LKTIPGWIFIGIGFVNIPMGLILFYRAEPFSFGKPVSTAALSQLGDYLGGTTGILWAVASVFFFYHSLVFQREQADLSAAVARIKEFRAFVDRQATFHSELVNRLQYNVNGYFSGFAAIRKLHEEKTLEVSIKDVYLEPILNNLIWFLRSIDEFPDLDIEERKAGVNRVYLLLSHFEKQVYSCVTQALSDSNHDYKFLITALIEHGKVDKDTGVWL